MIDFNKDIIVLGSIALYMYKQKYFNEELEKKPHDVDIFSLKYTQRYIINELSKLGKQGFDVLVKPYLDYDDILKLEDNPIMQINGLNYLSPIGCTFSTLRRITNENFKSRYIKDVMTLRDWRRILIHTDKFNYLRQKFNEYHIDDYNLIFYVNKYMYRLNPHRNSPNAVIAREFAILIYFEYILHKKYRLKTLDMHVYNDPISNTNCCGSFVFTLGKTYDGETNKVGPYTVVSLKTLIEENKDRPKLVRKLTKMLNENPDLK